MLFLKEIEVVMLIAIVEITVVPVNCIKSNAANPHIIATFFNEYIFSFLGNLLLMNQDLELILDI